MTGFFEELHEIAARPLMRQAPEPDALTPRDYFMAHAPQPAPEWFHATMAEPCPMVESLHSLPDGALKEEIKLAMWDGIDPTTPEGAAWMENRSNVGERQEAWQAEFRRQCFIQWPRAWADLMLEQRKC